MIELDIKQAIVKVVSGIHPVDELENAHKEDALAWVNSGSPIFRVSKPDNPPKHLVSYFVLLDEAANKLMLIDHIKSGLWLPAGGHVDINEHPKTTVIRETKEELDIQAKFIRKIGDKPLFITVTKTIGQAEHTDVSLWYVIAGDVYEKLNYEKREMHGYKWFDPQEILDRDISKFDPHMHRFTNKLLQKI